MRIFEGSSVLLTLALLLVTGNRELRKKRALSIGLAGASGLCLVVHLLFEGYRWQMLPVYTATVGLAVVTLRLHPNGEKPFKRAGLILALIALILGVALLLLLPVPRFPRPGGPYPIGTVTYHWIDASRVESYGDAPGGSRELMVQVWYPAEPTRGRPERWLAGGVATSRAMAAWSRFPRFLIDQTALAYTHAYAGAPISDHQTVYPVVVYVHGWGGFRNINPDQIEALVSNGYVVVSADHTYGALLTVFPDGRLAPNDRRALSGDGTESDGVRAATALVQTYAADAQFVLDQMAQLNAADPDRRFTGRLDVEHVGLFGHSTGGGAVVLVCAEDPRCQAVLGMDTWIERVADDVIARGLTQPLLMVNSEAWSDGRNNYTRQRHLYEAMRNAAYFLSIDGTMHFDFVAVPAISPLAPVLGVKGPLPAQRVMETNTTYLVAFFDKHLRGKEVPLLDGPSPAYPEVHFEKR
ncbi:MAG: dienelactone hydrolase family protein [Anaerolineae bacterium]|nr:dienelactone hydrolase family protein [Anaerolineae bacterium]